MASTEKPSCVHAADARGASRARPSARRAGTAAPGASGAAARRQPQAVQPRRLAADPRVEGDPDVLHAFGRGGTAAPGAVAGLEDPFALLLVERGAAQGEGGGDGHEGEQEAALHRKGRPVCRPEVQPFSGRAGTGCPARAR